MSNLEFTYGTMGSRKSATALMVAYDYKSKGINVLVLKSNLDTRDGEYIVSRALKTSISCILFSKDENLYELFKKENSKVRYTKIIVDEAQFLSKNQVDQLKKITVFENVDVLCYGLLTNYVTELFEGSKRLIELRDKLTVLDCTCGCCKEKEATINALIIDGKVVKKLLGKSDVEIGDTKESEKHYISMCYECWTRAEEYNKK